MKHTRLFTMVLIALLALAVLPAAAQDQAPWPTQVWATSTPEEQGLDSAELANVFEPYFDEYFNRDSLLVVRNGYIVAEAYAPPFESDMKHHMYSMSKSVTSALIGILLQEGYLESLDTPVLSLFPDRTAQNVDANKQALTVRHLLTMTSGFDCHDDTDETVAAMMASEDWLQFALDLPMAVVPGTEFNYCNPATYLLSSIITEKTGMSALDYAAQKLFAPLGITDYAWTSSPQGISLGFSDLQLTTRDIAKFGLLYLNGGQWDGQQIVPADYVAAAISLQIATSYPDFSYSYQWWRADSVSVSSAIGYAGQYIFLVPNKDLLVIMTGGFTQGLTPALIGAPLHYAVGGLSAADAVLPENPAALNQLNTTLRHFANPALVTVAPMPDIAAQIDGQNYTLMSPISISATGSMGDFAMLKADGLRFDFDDAGTSSITLMLEGGQAWTMPIGLNGLYHVSDGPLGLMGVKGEWETENIFCVLLKYVGDAEIMELETTFIPDGVRVIATELTYGRSHTAPGVVMTEE